MTRRKRNKAQGKTKMTPEDPTPKIDSFLIGAKLVKHYIVRKLTFEQFVNVARAAQEMTKPDTVEGRILRARMVQQVDYYGDDGMLIKFEMAELLQMPFKAARTLQALLNDEGKAGKLIGDGDGVTTALRYEFGTPIPIVGKEPLMEVEFLASTYGELEDVISGVDGLDQTLALLKIAKPVHETLQALPSWAVSAITLADGLTISQLVLPRFLEE